MFFFGSNYARMPVVIGSARQWAAFSPKEGLYFLDAQPAPTGVTSTGCSRRMPERWREILEQLSGELERQSAKLQELEIENQQLRGGGFLPIGIHWLHV